MNLDDITRPEDRFLEWDADNRSYVVEDLLPHMCLHPEVRQVIRWAYGFDGVPTSYEMSSDGSTCVPDRFMMGKIKEPPGVGHDFINRVPGHKTPDGHVWTATESCLWYETAMLDFYYGPYTAWFRRDGLWLTQWWWWCQDPKGCPP